MRDWNKKKNMKKKRKKRKMNRSFRLNQWDRILWPFQFFNETPWIDKKKIKKENFLSFLLLLLLLFVLIPFFPIESYRF